MSSKKSCAAEADPFNITPKSAAKKTSKHVRQDQSIMGVSMVSPACSLVQSADILDTKTNNSSIASKRAVEKYYGYSFPHVYRHFVRKPTRRSPLIHRGYWFRMYAIETVVRRFLSEPAAKRRVILNLGCGYDALPFSFLAKEGGLCRNTIFVDVDYPSLIANKSEIVKSTADLRDLLDKVTNSSSTESVSLRSEQYVAIGCDLRCIEDLDKLLKAEIEWPNCMVLVVTEVVLTYMSVKDADALLAYTAQLGEVRFCMLEQHLPAGAGHPFAAKMIKHFESIQTPLQAVQDYPRLRDQERRFLKTGWSAATARSLWDLWSDDQFITSHQRSSLNALEQFDEWEEFALFASHYFLLVASNTSRVKACESFVESTTIGTEHPSHDVHLNVYPPTPEGRLDMAFPPRKYGVLYQSRADKFCHHGGFGAEERLNSTDVYCGSNVGLASFTHDALPPLAMAARMCHTATTFTMEKLDNSPYDCLIAGGRASPDTIFADCWLRRDDVWKQAQDLPTPLYRHCAARITGHGKDEAVLVYGGRMVDGIVSNQWLIWTERAGWLNLSCPDKGLLPRFGASMISDGPNSGILLGGMRDDGTILSEIWRWSIDFDRQPPEVNLSAKYHKSSMLQQCICRFGATLTQGRSSVFLVGGIAHQGVLSADFDVVQILLKDPFTVTSYHFHKSPQVPAPLLVGHNSIWDGQGLVIVGGGAICFSFGNYTNIGVWRKIPGGDVQYKPWSLRAEILQEEEPSSKRLKLTVNGKSGDVRSARELSVSMPDHPFKNLSFEEIVREAEPMVRRGLKLGPCTHKWTTEYLKRAVGSDLKVVVHQSEESNMNFQEKNFRYVTKRFGGFVDEIVDGGKQYLRSLSIETPANTPANFETDFPTIAEDFILPSEMHFAKQNFHSSVLRISGPVSMWLHYDVMANVLCQIRGTKRMILYPPSDILHLKIPHGESNSVVNAFDKNSLPDAHPQEVVLVPGDILFIPPLWAHTTSPTDGVSIAVNVFFRNLPHGYAAGRDVYGNRDIQAYEEGRKDVAKIIRRFQNIPAVMGRFYLERLAKELQDKMPI